MTDDLLRGILVKNTEGVDFMILLFALLAMIAVLLVNTWLKVSKARKLQGNKPEFSQQELEQYAVTLQEMIRCKTVSVKGSYDDTEFAKLRAVVKTRFPLLHEKAEHRILADDFWLFKIPGKDPSRSIMLMSHHDVVPADEDWKYDPFSATLEDGKIFGRGMADTKGSLCGILQAMEELLQEGFVPEVNVFIGSSHNEELGGDGVTTARDWFKEQGITLEVILDEGGAIIDPPLGNMSCEKCAMVAVHEKGRCRLVCKATTQSSHISLTGYANNPVERISGMIHEISRKNLFVRRLHPEVKEMFADLAPYCGFPMNVLFCNLWLFGGLIVKVLPKINATAGGMVGTTCSFQAVEGSMTGKVCTANALLRFVNEEDLQKDLDAFRKVAKKYGVEVEIEYQEYYAPAKMSSPAYAYTKQCIHEVFPSYPAAPYILPAGTDAWKLTPVCDCALRFAPTRMSSEQLASIHAVNENMDVAAVAEAAAFYKHFVKNYPAT